MPNQDGCRRPAYSVDAPSRFPFNVFLKPRRPISFLFNLLKWRLQNRDTAPLPLSIGNQYILIDGEITGADKPIRRQMGVCLQCSAHLTFWDLGISTPPAHQRVGSTPFFLFLWHSKCDISKAGASWSQSPDPRSPILYISTLIDFSRLESLFKQKLSPEPEDFLPFKSCHLRSTIRDFVQSLESIEDLFHIQSFFFFFFKSVSLSTHCSDFTKKKYEFRF